MTDPIIDSSHNQDHLKCLFQQLDSTFPNLDSIPLHQDILHSPYLPQLARLLQLSIPIHAYPSEPIALYQKITEVYYQNFLKRSNEQIELIEQKQSNATSQIIFQNEEIQHCQLPIIQRQDSIKIRSRISPVELAKYIANFASEQEINVTPQLIPMGRVFSSWKVKEIHTPEFTRTKTSYKQESKYEPPSQMKFAKEKAQKHQSIKILLGKNISLECKQMRHEIMNRAKTNKLLQQNTRLTQLQKIGIQINYILNRITEEYFSDFLEDLKPYAKDEIYSFVLSDKIITKVMEEHNFINIYCKLVKNLKNESISLVDKQLKFKNIFIERLQQSFYTLIRKRQWQNKQQVYKKHLLGMSLFVGELFNIRFLSKHIFKDCFYQLMRSYVLEYQKFKDNKSFFYFQTYIECIIKIIEKMGKYYDQLLQRKNTDTIEKITNQLLQSTNYQDFNFKYICDFIEVLKNITTKLPSQRFKITFLLEDFRCSKVLKKGKEVQDNTQYQIIKNILSIDITNQQQLKRIPQMISQGSPQVLMKDFFYQFAEGTLKQVDKHIQIFKLMADCPGISDACIKAFKDNTQGLMSIDSDFPFLSEGIAKIMKIVCDVKRTTYRQLELGEQSHKDEDARQFLSNITEKHYKMIMQD